MGALATQRYGRVGRAQLFKHFKKCSVKDPVAYEAKPWYWIQNCSINVILVAEAEKETETRCKNSKLYLQIPSQYATNELQTRRNILHNRLQPDAETFATLEFFRWLVLYSKRKPFPPRGANHAEIEGDLFKIFVAQPFVKLNVRRLRYFCYLFSVLASRGIT